MEQRDQAPWPPDDDIERATAEATARAEAHDGFGPDGGPGSDGRRPKRWFIVGGVTVAALALAGGAAAIAGHSHSTSDNAQNAAATGSTLSPTPPATSQQSTSALAPSTPPPAADAKQPSTTKASTPPPSKTASSPSGSPSGSPTDESGGDCEKTSHDTPADRAVMFSGMTQGTQTAFLAAKKAAEAKGLSFVLNSGYRSAEYQARIFDCYVKELGSPQAARTWALPPEESAHVKGYAMDIAPPSAAAWLESTAGKYGLCRRFADETWHFEYQARYKTEGCPAFLPHP